MDLLITTQAKAVDDKFSDVKDRLTRIEGKDIGKGEVVTGNRQSYHLIIAAVAVVIALESLMVTIFLAMTLCDHLELFRQRSS